MRSHYSHDAFASCVVCGNTFLRTPIKNRNNLFVNRQTCGVPCQKKLASQTRKETGVDPQRINLICETCGKLFWCRPSARISANGSVKRFCSRACQGVSIRRTDWSYLRPSQFVLICRSCGKEKIAFKYGNPTYCSHVCAALGRAQKRGLANPTRPENAIRDALESIGEPFEQQRIIYPYVVDFFLPERNTVVECLGDYHHCNPAKFPNGPIDERQRRGIERDRERFSALESQGYRIVKLWASEIKRSNPNLLISTIC